MRRFWLVMLSLGLVLAFSASALAVDVKFNGSFYAAGMYLDKTSFNKDSYTIPSPTSTQNPGISTAFYYQRLRVGTEFIVSPGLKLVTRFDAMERIWGGARGESVASFGAGGKDPDSAGSRTENQNIAFDWMYVQYDSPIGTFRVGYFNDSAWGTVFMDTSLPRGKVAWSNTTGPWYYTLQIVKINDQSSSAVAPTTKTDNDNDKYVAAAKYTWSSGETGLLAGMGRDTRKRSTDNYYTLFYCLQPYAIAQFGPVKVQAEIDYFWGTWQDKESGSDVKMENLGVFVDAVADFGIVYAGGTFAYISGDDPATTDKKEGNSLLVNGGRDWNPCLILFNSDITYWVGAMPGYSPTQNPNLNDAAPTTADGMSNVWFFQGRAGVRPIAPLDIMASLSYAQADKKPLGVVSDKYGWEVDVTGTYKLTNNLSYMLGVGYLFTGDYYKGDSLGKRVNDNYMLINKLTLTF